MNVAQIEHIPTFTESLPAQDTIAQMEDLITRRRREMILWNNRRIRLIAFDEKYSDENWQISDGRRRLVNELTQAEMRLAEILSEIVEVAGHIYTEAGNAELRDCIKCEQRKAEAAADAEIAAEVYEGPISCFAASISCCPHGADPIDCEACYIAGDMAYNAAREKGFV